MTEPAKKQGGIKDIALGRSDLFHLAPTDLHVKEGWNQREESPELDEHIDTLAQSISQIGVKNPLTVYWEGGRAFISDGHCRFRAIRRAIDVYGAPLEKVPVITEDRYSSEADRILSMLVRNSGRPLTPFEQSKVMKRLLSLGWEEKDIAEKCGVTTRRVQQLLSLQAAPEEVKAMVRAGDVSASLAIDAVASAAPQEAVQNLQAAIENAKAAGKRRATPQHMPNAGARGGLKAELRDLIEGATVMEGEKTTSLVLTNEEFARLKSRIGL